MEISHIYVIAGIILAAPLIRVALIHFYSNGTFLNYFLTPCRADALGLGVLCALLTRDQHAWSFLQRQRGLLYGVTALLGLGVLALTIELQLITSATYSQLTTSAYGIEYSLLALFYASLLLVAITGEDMFVKTVFCNRLIMGLGTIAYGTYLFHYVWIMVIHILVKLTHLELNAVVLMGIPLVAIAIAIVMATLSWHFFEKPMVRRGHAYKY
jgi:peptidoglycan/LPS O-acetylase OafA/YrhL